MSEQGGDVIFRHVIRVYDCFCALIAIEIAVRPKLQAFFRHLERAGDFLQLFAIACIDRAVPDFQGHGRLGSISSKRSSRDKNVPSGSFQIAVE